MDFYKQNAEFLKENLVMVVSGKKSAVSAYEIKNIKTGPAIAYQGRLLCSQYDPRKEAERIIAGSIKPELRPDKVFVLSLANPYLVETLLKQDHRVIVIETDAALCRLVLTHWDFSGYKPGGHPALPGRLTIVVTDDENRLLDTLGDQISIGERISVVYSDTALAVNLPFYQSIIKHIRDVISFRGENFTTILEFGRIWTEQIIANMAIARSVYSLRELYSKLRSARYPIVITGAGPSLEKGLPLLTRYRDKFLLLAVDTSLPVLLDAGLRPDFIFSGDAQMLTREHFRSYDRGSDIIAAPCVYTDVLKSNWTRTFFFWYPHPFFELTGAFKGEELKSGGSISISAFDFSRKIDSATVLLLGQDYRVDPFKAYSRGTAYDNVNYTALDRFASRIKNNIPVVQVTSQGRDYYTWHNLLNYRNYLDYEIAAAGSGMRVIDLSDGILEKPEKMNLPAAARLLSTMPDLDLPLTVDLSKSINTRQYVLNFYKRMTEWLTVLHHDPVRSLTQTEVLDFLGYSVQDKIVELKSKKDRGVSVDAELISLYHREADRWVTFLQESLHV